MFTYVINNLFRIKVSITLLFCFFSDEFKMAYMGLSRMWLAQGSPVSFMAECNLNLDLIVLLKNCTVLTLELKLYPLPQKYFSPKFR